MKDLLLWASVVIRTSNMKISRRCLVDHVKKLHKKSVPQVQLDYFSSFNQSNHSFVTSSLPLLSSFLKLPNTPEMRNADMSRNAHNWMHDDLNIRSPTL